MPQNVIIVGAGITGAAIAFRLAQAGARVTVLDAANPASGASGASFGWLNASFFANEPHFRLRIAALDAHRALCRDLADLPTAWTGTLWWEETGAAFDRQANALSDLGYPLREVDRAAFAVLEPNVPPPERALLFLDEGATDLRALTTRLLIEAGRLGAQVWCGVRALELVTRGGAVAGVRIAQGLVEADQVVVAAGTGSADLLASLGLGLPMRRSPGLIVRTTALAPLIRHVLVSPGQELRQDGGGHLIAPTAAAHQRDRAETVDELPGVLASRAVQRIRALLPGISIHWDEVLVADRPIPDDGLPAVGPTTVEGLWLSVMHSGATLGPLIGALVASEVMGGEPGALLAPFRPKRFGALTP